MGEYAFVAERVAEIRGRVADAIRRSGREPGSVEIMAVTKFHPLAAVEAAYAAGLRHFGENRVQEAEDKFPAFLAAHPEARLELIGHLQSNKAKKAAGLFSRIQSVDSAELLFELAKRARARMEAEAGASPLEILLELHTGEESKSGFPGVGELSSACEALLSAAPELRSALLLRGLMTMAPFTSEEAPIRASFQALRTAHEIIAKRFGLPRFDVLSMGMTNDFELAIEEGSTLVRIGTAFFGQRTAP